MNKKNMALFLIIFFSTSASFSDPKLSEKSNLIQAKSQKAINDAIKSCNTDNGSNYSARPMIIKMKSPDSAVTMESEVELDGIALKSMKGTYSFNGYKQNEVSIKGKLNFTVNYINGSTANFTGKYSGNIKWKMTGENEFETEADYDYETVAENAKISYKGTVVSGGKKYRFNQDGSVSETN